MNGQTHLLGETAGGFRYQAGPDWRVARRRPRRVITLAQRRHFIAKMEVTGEISIQADNWSFLSIRKPPNPAVQI
jgi:hypothetical protein